MADMSPILIWYRRDLRLGDHPALHAAAESGRAVIPVFIHDETVEALGAAPKMRIGAGVAHLAQALEVKGSRLILRRGRALDVLQALIAETGAGAVYWTRCYDPEAVARDAKVKATLKEKGIEARSFGGHLLFEPWTVQTGTGSYYKVYSPYWKAVRGRTVEAPLPAPETLCAADSWPESDALESWQMEGAMRRGADVLRPYMVVGEHAAQERLARFIDAKVNRYAAQRDLPAVDGTSGLSENLAWGEISPHQCWHAGMRAMQDGAQGAETFLKELVWREFAYHLVHHTPQITTRCWRAEWEAFPWSTDETRDAVQRWKQGRTGMGFVDAAMREMYVTGRMHNRGRMIVACYLTKHLMADWRIGQRWFAECLIDWDPASNAMGWQWAAGCGPDAAPYFRVFNPETQLKKFDLDGTYSRAWIAEGTRTPAVTALAYFDAVPKSWGLTATQGYPLRPIVSAEDGRRIALSAYENRHF